jgi:hypothetical protein
LGYGTAAASQPAGFMNSGGMLWLLCVALCLFSASASLGYYYLMLGKRRGLSNALIALSYVVGTIMMGLYATSKGLEHFQVTRRDARGTFLSIWIGFYFVCMIVAAIKVQKTLH